MKSTEEGIHGDGASPYWDIIDGYGPVIEGGGEGIDGYDPVKKGGIMNRLKKRLKSKTIWLTAIAPTALAFMVMYEANLKEILDQYYQYIFMAFAALAWGSRETTNSSLDEK